MRIEDLIEDKKKEDEKADVNADLSTQRDQSELIAYNPIAAPANRDTGQSSTVALPTSEQWRNNYSSSPSLYEALKQTYTRPKQVDEKQMKNRQAMAHLADAASYLIDMVGDTAPAHGSFAAAEENKLRRERMLADEQNQQYDMMGYKAKMQDMQNGINELRQDRALKSAEAINKANREATARQKAADAANANAKWAKEMQLKANIADANDKLQWSKLDSDNKNKAAQRSIDYARLAQSKGRLGRSGGSGNGDDSYDIQPAFQTSKGVFGIRKGSVYTNSFYGQLYRLMKKDAEAKGGAKGLADLKLAVGEGSDQNNQMQAIVNSNMEDYPSAIQYIEDNAEYLGGRDLEAEEEEKLKQENAAKWAKQFNATSPMDEVQKAMGSAKPSLYDNKPAAKKGSKPKFVLD